MLDTREFPTYDDAANFLVGKGWFSTNAGWLNGKGKRATIVDCKDAFRNIPRHFRISVEPCDAMGRPIIND